MQGWTKVCSHVPCLLWQRMTTVHDVRHAPSLRLLAQELLQTELAEKTYEAETVTSWCALPKRVQSEASPHDKMRQRGACSRERTSRATATTGLLEPVGGRVVGLSSGCICCSRRQRIVRRGPTLGIAAACRAMDLTEKIKAQVKANTSDRYKLAVQVHIGAMEVRRPAPLQPLTRQTTCAPGSPVQTERLSPWTMGCRDKAFSPPVDAFGMRRQTTTFPHHTTTTPYLRWRRCSRATTSEQELALPPRACAMALQCVISIPQFVTKNRLSGS